MRLRLRRRADRSRDEKRVWAGSGRLAQVLAPIESDQVGVRAPVHPYRHMCRYP